MNSYTLTHIYLKIPSFALANKYVKKFNIKLKICIFFNNKIITKF